MPDDLRTRIAEALMRWAERNNSPRYAPIRRPETVTRNAYDRADAVLAVVQPELDRRDAAEAKARADIAAAEADLARCRERLEDTRRIVAEWEDAAAERDRYRSAWQSARRERVRLRGIIAANWEAAETFQDGGVNDIAELYRAQNAIQAAGGQLTRPVHRAIDAIRAKWDRVLRSEQQKRADAEAAVARVTALVADMRTWCSPHGLASHYANQLDQAIAGPNPNPPYDQPGGFRAGAGGEQ